MLLQKHQYCRLNFVSCNNFVLSKCDHVQPVKIVLLGFMEMSRPKEERETDKSWEQGDRRFQGMKYYG